MNKGFIERTLPPGADLLHIGDAERTPEVYFVDLGGDGATGKTMEQARRRAWERWAYAVLRDRLVWDIDYDAHPDVGTRHEVYIQYGGQRVTLTHWLSDDEWELSYELMNTEYSSILFSDFDTDVIEGLARMAMLSMAVHGMPDGDNK